MQLLDAQRPFLGAVKVGKAVKEFGSVREFCVWHKLHDSLMELP